MKYYSLVNGEMIEDKNGLWCKRSFETAYDKEEEIYTLYPKKVAKKAALKSIRAALKKIDVNILAEKVKQYAAECKDKDPTFIPHPSTWFNQERWEDVKVVQVKDSEEDFINKWGKRRPIGALIQIDQFGKETLVYEMNGITIRERPMYED